MVACSTAKPLLLKVMLRLSGPILRLEPKGWDAPPKPTNGEDRMNDGRAPWSPVLDFGFISVLEDHHLSFIIRSMCCIPAPVVLSNKLSAFRLSHSKWTIEPFGSLEVVVSTSLFCHWTTTSHVKLQIKWSYPLTQHDFWSGIFCFP